MLQRLQIVHQQAEQAAVGWPQPRVYDSMYAGKLVIAARNLGTFYAVCLDNELRPHLSSCLTMATLDFLRLPSSSKTLTQHEADQAAAARQHGHGLYM
ncbi:hypothetical protein OAO87_03945 [bacterium]|nr:hypothetical protein [bacterium]